MGPCVGLLPSLSDGNADIVDVQHELDEGMILSEERRIESLVP